MPASVNRPKDPNFKHHRVKNNPTTLGCGFLRSKHSQLRRPYLSSLSRALGQPILECLYLVTSRWHLRLADVRALAVADGAQPTEPAALPDETCCTARCAPHPASAVLSSPRIPWSRRGAGVPPRTPPSVVCVHTWNTLCAQLLVAGANRVFSFEKKSCSVY